MAACPSCGGRTSKELEGVAVGGDGMRADIALALSRCVKKRSIRRGSELVIVPPPIARRDGVWLAPEDRDVRLDTSMCRPPFHGRDMSKVPGFDDRRSQRSCTSPEVCAPRRYGEDRESLAPLSRKLPAVGPHGSRE